MKKNLFLIGSSLIGILGLSSFTPSGRSDFNSVKSWTISASLNCNLHNKLEDNSDHLVKCSIQMSGMVEDMQNGVGSHVEWPMNGDGANGSPLNCAVQFLDQTEKTDAQSGEKTSNIGQSNAADAQISLSIPKNASDYSFHIRVLPKNVSNSKGENIPQKPFELQLDHLSFPENGDVLQGNQLAKDSEGREVQLHWSFAPFRTDN